MATASDAGGRRRVARHRRKQPGSSSVAVMVSPSRDTARVYACRGKKGQQSTISGPTSGQRAGANAPSSQRDSSAWGELQALTEGKTQRSRQHLQACTGACTPGPARRSPYHSKQRRRARCTPRGRPSARATSKTSRRGAKRAAPSTTTGAAAQRHPSASRDALTAHVRNETRVIQRHKCGPPVTDLAPKVRNSSNSPLACTPHNAAREAHAALHTAAIAVILGSYANLVCAFCHCPR
jgi:hypothetical protein